MSILIRLISVDTIDSFPCVVIVTENSRILFDVAEGVQRLCVEHNVKLGKVNNIFVTRFSNSTICGIPGLCLTIADAGEAPIHIDGPDKLKTFLNSTRNFMRISGERLHPSNNYGVVENSYLCDGVIVHALRFAANTNEPCICSHVCYVGQTMPQKGKFDIQKAIDLQIPKGPLYGRLKNGNTIILDNGTVVTPEQVLGPAEESRYFIIVCNMNQFEILVKDASRHLFFSRFYENGDLRFLLDCVIHLSPEAVVQSHTYQSWMHRFDPSVHHILMSSSCKQSSFVAATQNSHKLHRVSPSLFAKVHLLRSSVAAEREVEYGSVLRPVLGAPSMEYRILPTKRRGLEFRAPTEFSKHAQEIDEFWSGVINGEDSEETKSALLKMNKVERYVNSSEFVDHVQSRHGETNASVDVCLSELNLMSDGTATLLGNSDNRLVFLGTGCAVPSKYRNVSGILLQMASTNSSMLMDVGEGTWSQLLRVGMSRPDIFGAHVSSISTDNHTDPSYVGDDLEAQVALKIAMQLRMVWISHPHADHHLGLLTVILERKLLIERHLVKLRLTNGAANVPIFKPLLVMAAPSILLFLQENVALNTELEGAFVSLSTRQLDPYDSCETADYFWPAATEIASFQHVDPKLPPHSSGYIPRLMTDSCKATLATTLAHAQSVFAEMGLRSMENVKVTHCKQSFGLILEGGGASSFKLVYSGDTRPCELLIKHGLGATILIHEATFEDDKLHEAKAKKHSTLGEALDVGAEMSAHRVVLTHFSQRYPSMPQIHTNSFPTSKEDSPEIQQYIRKVPLNGLINSCNFLVAFDFMHVSFRDLIWAPTVTPVLQRVFPPVLSVIEEKNDEEGEMKAVSAEQLPNEMKKINKDSGGRQRKQQRQISDQSALNHTEEVTMSITCMCCDPLAQGLNPQLAMNCTVHAVRGKRKVEQLLSSKL